ncbi:hypothetical protein CPC08DRAFT_549011 [Agrocybe pediades]|nr:hypothetical protein CPC08DRAFT_549011 [Agrocybe pediades]
MRQYCKCVLTVLDGNLSSNRNAHFVFIYYHLLHDPRYRLPRKLSYAVGFNYYYNLGDMDVRDFGDTLISVAGLEFKDSPLLYLQDINKIFNDLMEDTKKEELFAKSATLCLEMLCNQWPVSRDAGGVYGISRQDQRKKRDHPWHWRQMVPRPPSLGNRLALIGLRKLESSWYEDYELKLMKVRKALRNSMPHRFGTTRVITMREYFEVKSEPVPKTWPGSMQYKRPQRWPLFVFLLDLLPRILPLAGRYEPLVEMCRKRCLSSLSQVWPKKSRRVRQAIDSYLCRMDAQGECE